MAGIKKINATDNRHRISTIYASSITSKRSSTKLVLLEWIILCISIFKIDNIIFNIHNFIIYFYMTIAV